MKIIADSCIDFNDEVLPLESQVVRIPFTVEINEVEYQDIDDVVIKELERLNFKANKIQTSCASPGAFFDAIGSDENSFIIAISSKLSGSYQSAKTAVNMLAEDSNQKAYVFDSKSASAGENLVVLKVQELINQGKTFEEIVTQTENYISSMNTFFTLESMATMVSSGRVSKLKYFASKALKMYPIMGDDGNGEIQLKATVRGQNNIFPKLVELIGKDKAKLKDRTLAITHVNAPERANELKTILNNTYEIKDIIIFEASGLSSVYASEGGIIVAY